MSSLMKRRNQRRGILARTLKSMRAKDKPVEPKGAGDVIPVDAPVLCTFIQFVRTDPQTGDVVVDIPEECLQSMDWRAGDRLRWQSRGKHVWVVVNRSWFRRQGRRVRGAASQTTGLGRR